MSQGIFNLSSRVSVYPGVGGWRFISVPKRESAYIKHTYGQYAKGWGSLRVSVTLGSTSWQTSIFPDAKSATYLLPLKAAIRKKEGITDQDTVYYKMRIDL